MPTVRVNLPQVICNVHRSHGGCSPGHTTAAGPNCGETGGVPDDVHPAHDLDEELRAVLRDVSTHSLDGEDVPADLAVLWRAQLSGDTDLLDAYEMVLLDGLSTDEATAGFRVEDGVEPAAALALERTVDQIRFVAEAMDGALVGYWVGEKPRRVADSPVVVLDTDGQLELGGRTLAETLLAWTDPEDPEEVAEVYDALCALGIRMAADTHERIYARLTPFDDPNQVTLGYLIDERMRTSTDDPSRG